MKELCKHYAGSISYGTNLPTSDVDIRGIFAADKKNILTPFYTIREQNMEDEEDGKLYEVGTFLELYTKGNPNILETLWVDSEHLLSTSKEYWMLHEHRQALLSKKLAFTFSGYAVSQLNRIKGHNKWINNPQPEVIPPQAGFIKMINNFTDDKIFDNTWDINKYIEDHILIPYGNDMYGVVPRKGHTALDDKGNIRKYPHEDIPDGLKKEKPSFIVKYIRNEHVLAKDNFTNYWTWVNNRNKVRSALEKDFGYDCYSEDTEFLTEDGWKTFDNVGSSKLATFTKEHGIEYQNYTNTTDKLYTGDMYHFVRQETMVTANHHMYIRPHNRKLANNWGGVAACNLPETYDVLNVIHPELCDYCEPDVDTYGMSMVDYIKVLGWCFSAGHVRMVNGHTDSLEIRQHSNTSSMITTLSSLLEEDRVKCDKEYGKNTWKFSLNDIPSEFLDCTYGVLPNWVFHLSQYYRDLLLRAILQDEKVYKKGFKYLYNTPNKGKASDIQRLAFLCGYETHVDGPYEPNNMYKVHIDTLPSINKCDNRNNIVNTFVVDRRVVCFEVPNGTLVTRRKGKVSLHMNCKHAMHLVRLLRMGEEVLRDGVIHVKRPDAEELLAIRNGAWSYAELLAYAESKDDYVRKVLYNSSSLPKQPDIKLASQLLIDIREESWNV